jgi:hypothetical protein
MDMNDETGNVPNQLHLYSWTQHRFIVIHIVPLHVTVTPQLSGVKHCSTTTTTLNHIVAHNLQQNSNEKTL